MAVGVLFLRLHTLPERMAHRLPEAAVRGRGGARTSRPVHAHPPVLGGGSDPRAHRSAGLWYAAATDRGLRWKRSPGSARAKATLRSDTRADTLWPSRELNRARTSSLFPADDPSRLSLSPVSAGKADRQRDHSVLGVVRAAMGDRQLPHADRGLDHRYFLLPSVDEQRDVLLQNRADLPETTGALPRSMPVSAAQRRERRTDLPARQFATGSRRRVARRRIAETDAAMVVARADVLAADAQIQQAKAAHQQALDELQTKEELNRRNCGHRRAPRDRAAAKRREGPPGRDRCGHRGKAGRRGQALDAAAGPKGQRRGRTGCRPGGPGQNRHPRRRDRPGGAVRAPGRRYRQSVYAARRHPHPGRAGRRALRPASGRSKRR